jgi:hypothetical protein
MPLASTTTTEKTAPAYEGRGHIIYDRTYTRGVVIAEMCFDLTKECWGYLWVQTNGAPTFPQAELTRVDEAGAFAFVRQVKYDAGLMTPAQRAEHEQSLAKRGAGQAVAA